MPPSSNFERKASRSRHKAQTKLTFEPVGRENESSSPATKMSPARVRYQLPTPARSSQVPGSSATGRGLRRAYKDDDLPSFSPPASRDDLYKATSDDDEPIVTPLHKKKARKAPGAFASLSEQVQPKKKQIALPDSDSSEDDQEEDDEDDEDELSLLTPQPKKRGGAKAGPARSSGVEKGSSTSLRKKAIADLDEDEEDEPVSSTARRRSRTVLAISDDDDDEDGEDNEFPALPKLKVTTLATKLSGAHRGSDIIELSSDEEDSIVVPSSIKRRHSTTVVESESDQEPISSPLKRRKETSESEDSDIIRSPTKRSRPTLVLSDEDEDDDMPRDRPQDGKPQSESNSPSSAVQPRVTRQARTPRKQHRTAKQKAAELLRRKRAGEKIDELTDSSSDNDEDVGALYDSDSEHHVLQHFSDEESGPESVREREPAQHTSGQNDDGAENDDGTEDEDDDEDEDNPKWVIDDGTDYRIGVPDMPLQFSRQSHRPLKENFEDCVEWLLRKALDPEFSGADVERFNHAFIKVDDEARGYATSSFLSSQWTAEFTAAIKARPVLTMRNVEDGEGYTVEGVPKCDACNHRKHPPKYALSFRGEPYVKKTLEDVEQDSDYEGDEDGIPVDEDGNDLVPSSKEWFSGRDCSDKAFQAHKLIHWKYSLNDAVGDILRQRKYMKKRRIAERDAMSEEDREAYANQVVQAWIEDGTIRSLYREFKDMMETARSYEPRRYR